MPESNIRNDGVVTRRVWLKTGIPNLDELLTSSTDGGVAVPSYGGIRSSSMIIKAQPGAGKSVLATTLALNLNNATATTNPSSTPFVIYFSFAQPAAELDNYIREIVAPKDKHFPLIISPREGAAVLQQEGMTSLRRCIVDQLTHLVPYTAANPLGAAEPISAQKLDADLRNILRGSWDMNAEDSRASTDRRPILPIVFVDPLNCFFDYADSRKTISALFQAMRTFGWPLIATLEDPRAMTGDSRLQCASDVEFEADVVLSLTSGGASYSRRKIEVTKSRHARPRFGTHSYRIEKTTHALSNIINELNSPGETHAGLLIFPSPHWVLSESRSHSSDDERRSSGMNEFDAMLTEGLAEAGGPSLHADSIILVSGRGGGHKLTVAFNLLVAGLPPIGGDAARAGAILLSFGEETGINVPGIAMASDTPEDNGRVIGDFGLAPEAADNGGQVSQGKKVIVKEWHASNGNCLPLVEATFRPGYLGSDEFLWVVQKLVATYKPRRIMVDNTAHIRMRLPDLANDDMLFPALCGISHKNKAMLIIVNVTGDGSDDRLTYGLEAMADYLIDLDPPEFKDETERKQLTDRLLEKDLRLDNPSSLVWAKMSVRNIRDKNYNNLPRYVTVVHQDKSRKLCILKREVA